MVLQLKDIISGIDETKIVEIESLKKYGKEDTEIKIRKLSVTELSEIGSMKAGMDFEVPMDVMDKMLTGNVNKEQAKKELVKNLKKEKIKFSSKEQAKALLKSKLQTIAYGLDTERKGNISIKEVDRQMPDEEVMDELYTKIILFTNGGVEEDIEKAVDDFPEKQEE
ncbi:MAG: hypothetical protein LBM02_08210 [Lachnospiraceae bacterium]|jgi:hypothetical protein|nr:hypothetical protein [Lachnospiraceae bacterium]